MKKVIVILLLLCSLTSVAQRQLRVVDVETLVPIAGVNVLGKRFSAQTDSTGVITLPDSCRTLSFSHVNYESRLLNINEIHGGPAGSGRPQLRWQPAALLGQAHPQEVAQE